MKPIFIITGCLAYQLLCITAGWSHGVWGHVVRSEGHLVTAEYDDGEPMAYAAVEIKSPGSDIAFQTGRTDRNGHFMFSPDQQGQWRIVVQDGMGHRLALDAEVSADAAVSKISEFPLDPHPLAMTRAGKVIIGLSIIFGIFGLWYGWKGRRGRHDVLL